LQSYGGKLKNQEKDLVWIISVWIGNLNTLLVAIPKGTIFSVEGKDTQFVSNNKLNGLNSGRKPKN
jgi:hypothetical protein